MSVAEVSFSLSQALTVNGHESANSENDFKTQDNYIDTCWNPSCNGVGFDNDLYFTSLSQSSCKISKKYLVSPTYAIIFFHTYREKGFFFPIFFYCLFGLQIPKNTNKDPVLFLIAFTINNYEFAHFQHIARIVV